MEYNLTMYPQIIPYFCVGYIIGVGVGSAYSPVSSKFLYLLLVSCVCLFFVSRYHLFRYGLVFLGAFTIGLVLSDLASRHDQTNISFWRNASNQIAKFEGRVESVEQDGLSLKILVAKVKKLDDDIVLPGVVEIKTAVSDKIGEGDEIKFIGKIGIPENYSKGTGHFDPRRYYARYGIYATMVNPRLQIVSTGKQGLLTNFRQILRIRFSTLLPEPDAGLFSATLLGFMHDVPRSLRNDFSNSGLAHLVAISGQHVGMLAIAIFFIATIFGMARINAMIITAIISAIFIALVDFPPSGIRSVIMVAVVYWAYASGRKSQGLRILLMATVLMLMVNPRILLADLGFQLSVLAMWGLIVFYPLGQRLLFRSDAFGLKNVLLMTVCAMVTTTPLIAYSFGRVSLIGLLSNMFAAPLYPPLMLLGVLILLLGWLPLVQGLLLFVTHALMNIFIGLVEFSAKLPGANIQLAEFKIQYLIIFYFLLFLLSIIFSRSTRRQFWPIKELFMVNKFGIHVEQTSGKREK